MEIRVQTSTNYINQNYQFKLIKNPKAKDMMV